MAWVEMQTRSAAWATAVNPSVIVNRPSAAILRRSLGSFDRSIAFFLSSSGSAAIFSVDRNMSVAVTITMASGGTICNAMRSQP